MSRYLDRRLLARYNTDCDSGYQFYKCQKGPFLGCCASDPCTTGICPDEDQPKENSSSDSQSSTTTTESSTSDPISTSTSSSLESSTSATSSSTAPTTSTSFFTTASSAISSSSSTIPPAVSSATSPTSPTSSTPAGVETGHPEQPDPQSNNAALIGGIVGGVLGALLIAGIFIFWFIRRRRKQKPEDPTSESYNNRLQKPTGSSGGLPEKPAGDENENATGELEGCYNARNSKTISELYASSDQSTLISSPMLSRTSPSMGSPSTAASPGFSRENPLTTLNESYSSDGQDGHWNTFELFVPPQSQSQQQSPSTGHTASELTDTSRVELPGHNHGHGVTRYSQGVPNTAPPEPIGRGMATNELSVTTPDGVVLKPNLNQSDEQDKRASMQDSHVMSFMNYRGEQSSKKGAGP